jgi:hypothetical protein
VIQYTALRRIRFGALLLAALAACRTGPESNAAGVWTGSLNRTLDRWTLEMSLARTADSLTGATDVHGSTGFGEHYVVTGTQRGDSVVLRMVPVEDATINVAGIIAGDEITGRLWFNANTGSAQDIVFTRH